jgi:hypothetical protein
MSRHMTRRSGRRRFASSVLAVTLALALAASRIAVAADGLSDAAKETRKKADDQNVLVAKSPAPRNDGCSDLGVNWLSVFVSSGEGHHYEEGPRQRDPFAPTFHLGLSGGNIAAGGGNFESGAGFAGLQFGGTWSRARMDLDELGWGQRFTPSSTVHGALDHPVGLALDLSARYLPRRGPAALGIAPMMGIRVETLFWKYHNGVWIDNGADPIYQAREDNLVAWSPYLGLAVTLVDRNHFQLASVVKSGARFWAGYTDQGLRNDMFRTTGFVQLGLETTFPF